MIKKDKNGYGDLILTDPKWTMHCDQHTTTFMDCRSEQSWQLPNQSLSQYSYDRDLVASLQAFLDSLPTKKLESYCAFFKPTYMKRLANRQYKNALKEDILFGLILGWVLVLMASFHYFILLERKVWFWTSLIGLCFVCLALIVPQALRPIRKIVKLVSMFIADCILKLLLLVIYCLIVSPVGYWWQKSKGSAPFYNWETISLPDIEGWTDKHTTTGKIDKKRAAFWQQPFEVFSYFATHSQIILLPCLLLFLVLGLVSVFLQSSAIAPMIYSLF